MQLGRSRSSYVTLHRDKPQQAKVPTVHTLWTQPIREKRNAMCFHNLTRIFILAPPPGARQVLPRLIHRQRSGLDSALCIIDWHGDKNEMRAVRYIFAPIIKRPRTTTGVDNIWLNAWSLLWFALPSQAGRQKVRKSRCLCLFSFWAHPVSLAYRKQTKR